MIYIVPTKRGIGCELWGTYEDLFNLYEVIGKFWNDQNQVNIKGLENRDQLISGFSYEIRKAKDGSRLTRTHNHFFHESIPYFGVQISWVHFLFSLTAIKFNMRIYETDRFDVSTILQLEFWLERAMVSFDQTGGEKLAGYISDGIYAGNPYLYQFMRSINLDFFKFGGGKIAFRKLPQLMQRSVYLTEEYNEYLSFLTGEAKRLNCKIDDLELSDEEFDYEGIKW
jgi:hypothetical protein